MNNKATLANAYRYCQYIAKNHYENFPVASKLLPKRLRRPVSVIYAFARTADDIADEGDALPTVRLQRLAQYHTILNMIEYDHYHGEHPIFIALNHVIKCYQLPVDLFRDLLYAFEQDVMKNQYETFDEILDYCKNSAHPIGRLMLLLQGDPTEQQLIQSDAICSALQLINFYQDIIQDLTESGRLYLPQEECRHYSINPETLLQSQSDSSKLAPLMREQYQRAAKLMTQGYPLGMTLSGRLGWEIRTIILGGAYILHQLMGQPDNALLQRPRLSKYTLVQLLSYAVSKHHYAQYFQHLLGR